MTDEEIALAAIAEAEAAALKALLAAEAEADEEAAAERAALEAEAKAAADAAAKAAFDAAEEIRLAAPPPPEGHLDASPLELKWPVRCRAAKCRIMPRVAP